MAIPPFNDLRLKKGEHPDQRRLEELFEGYARNLEDLYNRYQTTEAQNEVVKGIIKVITGTSYKANFGTSTLTFSASQTSAETKFAHGIGRAPKLVLSSPGATAMITETVTRNATEVGFKGFAPGGVTTGTFNFDWLIIG